MKSSFFRSVLVGLCLTFGAATVSLAADLSAEKARMSQRLPKLDALKSSGAIGENNRGLAEVRSSAGDAAEVVVEENQDRTAVYAAIATRAGSSADQVGRARAKQIAASSAKGVWLQHEDGSWYQK